MSEANKEEIDKCKQIAKSALANGDAEKATRILQKAKRMCPTDTSIDEMLAAAQVAASSPGASSPSAKGDSDGNPTASEGFRHRGSTASTSSGASSNVRTSKDGHQYTTEQMGLVQRILRTKDYYDILEVPKNASEEVAKKAYKKLALKLHPDKNRAPGADEAFKKLSKAFQCLTDPEKKQVYDTYGDEERIPQQHRHYQQDFMTPEDLFAAFFGGGPVFHQHQRHHAHHQDDGQAQRMQIFQALPVLLLVLLTLSNFAKDGGGGRFSFQANNAYRNERSTATLNVPYYVTDDFEEHYSEGTRSLAEFDRQVEIYHIRNLGSDCDYQEKTQYKKVLQAKRRRNEDELQEARNLPRPACKELERVKKKWPNLFRSAMYMGGY